MPTRKQIRLTDYDYSQNGAYFITICTQDNRHLFGEIVGAIHESPLPKCRLWTNGEIAQGVIQHLSGRFPHIHVDRFVIMPNHIHLMLRICPNNGVATKRSELSKAVGYLKMNISKIIHGQYPDLQVWQRGYYDHVIRNHESYCEIMDYIQQNPTRWVLRYKR